MFALLFDRKSLLVTGIALAGIGLVLFAAGFLLGVTANQERQVVAPYWLQRGPVLPGETATTSGGPAGSPEPAAATGGGATEGEPVPFGLPGELKDLGEGDAGGATDGDAAPSNAAPADTAPSNAAPADGGARSTPAHSAPPAADSATRLARRRPSPPPATVATATEVELEALADAGPDPETAARPEPPAAASPEDGAPLDGSWYVQTGAFSVSAYAHDEEVTLAERFADRGYRPYLRPITDRRGRRLLTVRLGPFASRGEAVEVASVLDDVLIGREQAPDLAER